MGKPKRSSVFALGIATRVTFDLHLPRISVKRKSTGLSINVCCSCAARQDSAIDYTIG